MLFMIVPYFLFAEEGDVGQGLGILLEISVGYFLFCFILFCVENWRWLFPDDGK